MGNSLKGTKSHENLKHAFAGESQANRRYLYFARRADIEGYPDVGGLFRDTSEAETGHAFGHMDFLKEVGDPATGVPIGNTEANLKSAIEGETYEYTQMYPGMAKTARDEGFAEFAEWFETLAKAERSHANRFTKGLDSLKQFNPSGVSREIWGGSEACPAHLVISSFAVLCIRNVLLWQNCACFNRSIRQLSNKKRYAFTMCATAAAAASIFVPPSIRCWIGLMSMRAMSPNSPLRITIAWSTNATTVNSASTIAPIPRLINMASTFLS